MEVASYVETLRRDLAVAAEAGGDDARALAERLSAPLESSIRLMLLDALSAAADDITRELAPGSVELRLRGGEPEFVVSAAPAHEPAGRAAGGAGGRRAARSCRGGGRSHGADQPPPPRAAQGGRRAGRRPRAALRQRLARPRRRRRGGGGARGSAPARRPRWPGLHRMGPMTFDTPQPISATLDVVVGDVRVTAGERADTVVDVRPSDPSNEEDRKAAEQTRVEYEHGHLLVKTPKLPPWSIRRHRR